MGNATTEDGAPADEFDGALETIMESSKDTRVKWTACAVYDHLVGLSPRRRSEVLDIVGKLSAVHHSRSLVS